MAAASRRCRKRLFRQMRKWRFGRPAGLIGWYSNGEPNLLCHAQQAWQVPFHPWSLAQLPSESVVVVAAGAVVSSGISITWPACAAARGCAGGLQRLGLGVLRDRSPDLPRADRVFVGPPLCGSCVRPSVRTCVRDTHLGMCIVHTFSGVGRLASAFANGTELDGV